MLDGYLPPRLPVPRKRPTQERSRETMAWIRQAAEELLTEDGRAALTTTRVAERAGVSIGTLYQYVSSVDELMALLVEAHLERERAALVSVLSEVSSLPLSEILDRLVDAFVGVFSDDPVLSAALYRECRSASWRPEIEDLGADSVSAFTQILLDHEGRVAVHDPRLASIAVVSAVDAFVQRAAAQAPEAVRSGAVAREAKQLVRRYLLPPGRDLDPIGRSK